MTGNNPNLDIVNMNAYITFVENLLVCSQDIQRKQNSGINQGPYSSTNVLKMMRYNPNLDLVNINSHIKFGELLSICSQNIERKRNFGINQRPYNVRKMTCNNPKLQCRCCQFVLKILRGNDILA